MAWTSALQDGHLRDWLLLASDPHTSFERLLRHLFEQTLTLTASDAGGAVLVREDEGSAPTVVVRGTSRERAAGALGEWLEKTRLSPREALPGDIAELGNGFDLPFSAEGRSSLMVPLVENRRTIGVMVLQSSRPRFYDPASRAKARELACDATCAICRCLGRNHLARCGLDLDLVGVSGAFLELEHEARKVAAHPKAPVLILGERGTGKELTARLIHAWSERREQAFVPILASALADSLVADELYGHEAHSFTGASARRDGKFQLADHGTLFLDEVADMPLPIQSSLLRVVERGEIQRVGRDRSMQVDVRILAATNRDLEDLMERREFRSDLYDRLGVLQIRVPPLRERKEDIPLLATFFLRKYCQQLHRYLDCDDHRCDVCAWTSSLRCMSPEFSAALQSYGWPGNVRELANLMLRLLATVESERLEIHHLPWKIRERRKVAANGSSPPRAVPTEPSSEAPVRSEPEDLSLEEAVRSHIRRVLEMADYRQSRAARLLGLPYSTLQSKMKKLGIEVQKP